jgi:hypothetical protein
MLSGNTFRFNNISVSVTSVIGNRIGLRCVFEKSRTARMKPAGSLYGDGYRKDCVQYREHEDREGIVSAPTVIVIPFLPNDRVTASADRCSPSNTIACIINQALIECEWMIVFPGILLKTGGGPEAPPSYLVERRLSRLHNSDNTFRTEGQGSTGAASSMMLS